MQVKYYSESCAKSPRIFLCSSIRQYRRWLPRIMVRDIRGSRFKSSTECDGEARVGVHAKVRNCPGCCDFSMTVPRDRVRIINEPATSSAAKTVPPRACSGHLSLCISFDGALFPATTRVRMGQIERILCAIYALAAR